MIYTLNGQPLSTLTELRKMLDQHEPDHVVILQIERDRKITYIEMPAGFEALSGATSLSSPWGCVPSGSSAQSRTRR